MGGSHWYWWRECVSNYRQSVHKFALVCMSLRQKRPTLVKRDVMIAFLFWVKVIQMKTSLHLKQDDRNTKNSHFSHDVIQRIPTILFVIRTGLMTGQRIANSKRKDSHNWYRMCNSLRVAEKRLKVASRRDFPSINLLFSSRRWDHSNFLCNFLVSLILRICTHFAALLEINSIQQLLMNIFTTFLSAIDRFKYH